MIKGYHSYNKISNASESIEDILKKQKKVRFSEAGASHQNGESEHVIKVLVTIASIMFMHYALKFTENILSTDICKT